MAKVTGPLMSLDASGSIAGTITFSKWKGRPYVRNLVKPSNPKSPLQVSTRSMMKFLSQNWAAIGTTPKASWKSQADAIVASNFNAYVKENMRRYTQFTAPGQTYPVAGTGTFGTEAAAPLELTAAGGVGQITITCAMDTANDNWGLMIFRNPTTTFTASRSNLIAAVLQTATGDTVYIDSGLAPAAYFYTGLQFTMEGNLETTQMAEVTATAT